jgi:hypothetical protein
VASVVIPGVGPVIAAGVLAAALGGAAAGAAGGSVVGALVGLEVPEAQAKHYEHEFHSGHTLVTVRAEGRYDEAVAILRRAAERPETRAPEHGRGGGYGLTDVSDSEGGGSVFTPRP